MTNPLSFYNQEKEILEEKLSKLKKQLYTISSLRLLVFLITVFSVYFFFGEITLVAICAFVGIVLFGLLLVKNAALQIRKQILVEKIKINSIEISVLQGNFDSLDSGKEFVDANHFFSNDIDLFGERSFYQYSNRTATKEGAALYAKQLTENSITNIEEKQKAIQELSSKVHWRQHFSAIASLVKVEVSSQTIIKYIKDYKEVLPNYNRVLITIFPFTSLVFIGLVSFGLLPFSYLVAWFFMGLFITGTQVKKTSKIYNQSGKAKETFKQYYKLLEEIEKTNFTTSILKEQQQKVRSENEKASVVFYKFSKILDSFDQRNNVLIALVGNAFFLWDIQNAYKVEKWISKYKNIVENWFDVITFFDAQNTLANFHFNHPIFVFPVLLKEKAVVKATKLGHPLLNSEKRVDNDFEINKEQFYIVTGANMAGKSTFLRTVSLTIVMANLGLPVCAEQFEYAPIKLITSMRTSDSLADDESYFYSELKRLKFIVDQIADEDYFIVLDEILKGTNSKDKAIGSKKFVEKLNASKSTGIIATHDVSLCVLEQENESIENYFFDAEIHNDELHFDYTLKKGICKNMNASFLLKKMKIV
ncbi:MAG: DNA mismatch repair protein MutS [Flavobacteriaceae bacterium]|nr:DNA mismatch repair protein MutS [Flavobacteriaceae bacterium]